MAPLWVSVAFLQPTVTLTHTSKLSSSCSSPPSSPAQPALLLVCCRNIFITSQVATTTNRPLIAPDADNELAHSLHRDALISSGTPAGITASGWKFGSRSVDIQATTP
ncbi:hypothetical protein D9C73_025530 [Collichthys lucidus]|uniref:Secreted protein n=1 Tax=Collichthys lucidus TaxID=240159 RepID=A0A4U5VU88_COLLU|nr:hypothetical protein D9C73_025530 [Collichthys lucidus]